MKQKTKDILVMGLKAAVTVVTGIGVGVLVKEGVRRLTPAELNLAKTIAVRVAQFGVTGAITVVASNNTNGLIDDLVGLPEEVNKIVSDAVFEESSNNTNGVLDDLDWSPEEVVYDAD